MKYEVWFKLVNEEKELEVNFKSPVYNQPILAAVKNFNEAGEIARNRKHIYKTEIEEHIIKIFFESDIDLESPTKSFRFFSKDLIDSSKEYSDLVINKRLLKGVFSNAIIEENSPMYEMSDEEMITTLVHWCMSKEVQSAEEKKNKKITIDKIKQLIKECSIMNN